MRSSIALLAVAATAVTAQAVQNYTSELDMVIDPNSVDLLERAQWCAGQTDTCSTLCDDNTKSNTCDNTKLTYECLCASNGSAPGLQYYTQSLPTRICETLYGQCNAAHTSSAREQDQCTTNIKDLCGTLDTSDVSGGDDSDDDGSSSTTKSDSATTATTAKTEATTTAVTTTDSDGLAGPTLAPMANGVAAVALGVMAYLV